MKTILSFVVLAIMGSHCVMAQTIYVPNADIGYSSNTNIGIGTGVLPAEKLEVAGKLRLSGAGGYYHSELLFYRSDGTKFASIGQSNLNTMNSTFDIQHFNGNDIRFVNNGVEHLRINVNGNVGIGASNIDAKLTVAGDVHAREMRVTITAGSDFVFQNDYNLRPLAEVEKFIDENKHLPDVASAAEMETNGLELGKMDMKLLQKIEELTLYMIDLKKEMDGMKKENKQLKDKISELEKN